MFNANNQEIWINGCKYISCNKRRLINENTTVTIFPKSPAVKHYQDAADYQKKNIDDMCQLISKAPNYLYMIKKNDSDKELEAVKQEYLKRFSEEEKD